MNSEEVPPQRGWKRTRGLWPNGSLGRKALAIRPIALPILLLFAILVFWDWSVVHFDVSPKILVGPWTILALIREHPELLLPHLQQTAWETGLSCVLSIIVGLVVGVLLGQSSFLRRSFYPHLVTLQVIPKVALMPLFITWLGTGAESRISFAIFMSFFPVALSTMVGVIATPPRFIVLAKGLGATEWQILSQIRLPFALSYIFTGIKVAVTMCVTGVVVGEFVTSKSGLGYLIVFASYLGSAGVAFASILLLCGFGSLLFGIVALAESIFTRWYPTDAKRC
jgi:NitT/TauT family transport system permease protein